MRNNILKSLLVLLVTTLTCMISVQAEELEEVITLSVSPLFTVTKKASSIESASINPETGIHSGLQTVYDIVTNGTDDDYDITLTSSIVCDAGVVSAYGNSGSLLFANEAIPPTEADVNNAKANVKNNPNVIAYPVSISVTSPMTSSYYSDYKTFGSCYVLLLNNAKTGTYTFGIQGTPVSNTYSNTLDQAGSYKSVVTFTVTPKI